MKFNIEKIFNTQKFDYTWGVAKLQRPLSMALYENWIRTGQQGSMEYLATHLTAKSQPHALAPQSQSAIVFGIYYAPTHPYPHPSFPLSGLGIAKYAQGQDYHHWLAGLLSQLCETLKAQYPNESFKYFTDKEAVLERDLAYRASLGWVGKNSCLIKKDQGSFFLIGEIFTSLPLENSQSLAVDHCGTCQRCIQSCPTQAINADRTIDARKCISYWTIESSALPAKDLRQNFANNLFGCDICQDVCPWNKAIALPAPLDLARFKEDLKWILNSSNKELQKKLFATALSRAAGNKLKRNALIIIENLNLQDLKTEVELSLNSPQLRPLAQEILDSWA